MSHFTQISLKIKDAEAIILAFSELYGIDAKAWEVHDTPKTLSGWGNRKFKAHLVLRHSKYKNTGINTSWSKNDIGFLRNDAGEYNLVITDENKSWWQTDRSKVLERIGVITTERILAKQPNLRYSREISKEGRLQIRAIASL